MPSNYDIDAIRQQIKSTLGSKGKDPDEFRPEKAKSQTEAIKYRFFVMPPTTTGEKLKCGTIKHGMDNQYFIPNGNHWHNEKPTPCPRVWDGSECPVCQYGFDLLKEEKAKSNEELRKTILKTWMPTTYYMMNIFFPHSKANPEDLRGRVMFYNAPKTIIDFCNNCLYRDDAGDAESPEAFGVFFDENNAFLFELQATKQGKNNSYKTSKFLPTRQPIVSNPDKTPDTVAIAAMLHQRHDLYSKIEVPDAVKIRQLAAVMQSGDDSGSDAGNGGFDSDETTAPAAQAAKTAPVTTTSRPTTTRAAQAAPVVEEEEDLSQVQSPVATKPAATTKPTAAKTGAPATKPAVKTTTPVVEEDLPGEVPLVETPADAGSEDIDALIAQLGDAD